MAPLEVAVRLGDFGEELLRTWNEPDYGLVLADKTLPGGSVFKRCRA
jgi:hypothetical protein